jgi:hypothetical protein
MNILKLYAVFLQTSHLIAFNYKKINLFQYNPLFFEGNH